MDRQIFTSSVYLAEHIMRDALENFNEGIAMGGRRISNLRYADGTTLVSSSKKDLIELLKAVKAASQQRGLLLNTKKTKGSLQNSTGG